MVIRKLVATAWLAEPGSELEGARERAARGDDDWSLWVEEFDRGEATLIDMRVCVVVELDDGSDATAAVENHQIWVHLGQHPPVLAASVAELSGKDFDLLSGCLRERGVEVSADQLAAMYVTVDLASELVDALRPRPDAPAPPGVAARPGVETENG